MAIIRLKSMKKTRKGKTYLYEERMAINITTLPQWVKEGQDAGQGLYCLTLHFQDGRLHHPFPSTAPLYSILPTMLSMYSSPYPLISFHNALFYLLSLPPLISSFLSHIFFFFRWRPLSRIRWISSSQG